MNSDRLKQIEEICNEVLKLPETERQNFLHKTCGADVELVQEVESLLKFNLTFDSFIDSNPNSIISEIFTDKDDFCGRQIDRYRIISLIGKGGMGSVYLAEDTELDRKVAIKFLQNEYGLDTNKLKRFRQEAKATSALNHPNILTVYEIGKVDNTNYIVTEFIEGKTLRDLISEKDSLALREIIKIAIQTAEAIAQAHTAGIIHRDIKPENIMVRTDGYVKVLDFGLAKLFESDANQLNKQSQALSTPGLIKGTVSYMSPEQARGLNVDKRTDIWSFGVVLYEILTGKTPFSGETLTDTLVSIIHEEPHRLNLLRSDIPSELSLLINKSLQKTPNERYPDFEDLFEDLKSIKRNLDFAEHEHKNLHDLSEDQETRLLDSSSINQAISDGKASSPHNLSSEMSPLFGRVKEIAQISKMLQNPNIRLVTLTGTGGTGKTRTAKSVASTLLNKFSDGVFFIDLAMVEDPDLVIPFIASTLEVKEDPDQTEIEILKIHLKQKNALLVLDNFEQIVEAAPQIGELITTSSNLKILITSRVRLQLSFENEVTIQPLEFPTDKNLTIKEIARYAAITLFVERAKSAKPNFSLTENNAEDVVAICQRLDGLPLAIELAAARIKLFAPKAILKRLENSLKLLTGGAKDLPERQQTMRQTIVWSYDLLTPDEKTLLNRVSVFRGGFSIEATEEVTKLEEESDVFDILTSLIDKSLIVQKEQEDGEPRFRLLVVVKEFAREQLAAHNETFEIKKRHSNFYLELATEAELNFERGDEVEWLDKIEIEIDNFRAALEWSLENDPDIALKISAYISSFWIRRNYLTEAERWTSEALRKTNETADKKVKAKAFLSLGSLNRQVGKYEISLDYFNKALNISEKMEDKLMIANSLEGLGAVKLMEEDLSEAKEFYQSSYKLAKELNDKYETASTANGLGIIYDLQEDYQTAVKYFEESLALAREISFNKLIQISTVNLAGMALRFTKDYGQARSYALESIEIAYHAGDKITVGYALEIFAALATIDNNFERAIQLSEALYAIYDEADYEMEFYEKDYLESYLVKARAELTDEELAKANETGRKMSLEKVVRLAKEEII
jgi:non-specific serine/threonine protein kinase